MTVAESWRGRQTALLAKSLSREMSSILCALGEAQVGEQMKRTCLPTRQGEGAVIPGNQAS